MYGQMFALPHLLNTHQIFQNELVEKTAAVEEDPPAPLLASLTLHLFLPRTLAIIRRRSVAAVSDRWVGLWALSRLADTKFHWQSEQNDLLDEQRHRKCWQADHEAAGWRKRREDTPRGRQREGVKGDWHVCIISLLLSCLWSLVSLLCRWWNLISILIITKTREKQGISDTPVTSVPHEETPRSLSSLLLLSQWQRMSPQRASHLDEVKTCVCDAIESERFKRAEQTAGPAGCGALKGGVK